VGPSSGSKGTITVMDKPFRWQKTQKNWGSRVSKEVGAISALRVPLKKGERRRPSGMRARCGVFLFIAAGFLLGPRLMGPQPVFWDWFRGLLPCDTGEIKSRSSYGTAFDRLCVFSTVLLDLDPPSWALGHWRCSVAIGNYVGRMGPTDRRSTSGATVTQGLYPVLFCKTPPARWSSSICFYLPLGESYSAGITKTAGAGAKRCRVVVFSNFVGRVDLPLNLRWFIQYRDFPRSGASDGQFCQKDENRRGRRRQLELSARLKGLCLCDLALAFAASRPAGS